LKTKLNTLNDVRIIDLQTISDDTGRLVVMESGEPLSMQIKRIFTVLDQKNIRRGCHAHKECTQILICQNGICEVLCDDGKQKELFVLDNPSKGLSIPASIWSEQFYKTNNTLLLVLCDQLYEKEDYIRNYADFENFRKSDGKKEG
jgi:dTDP-4-dehydrorhamnose 3,5-epimerase-like enzyme